jgi:hypothetical protein
VFALVVGLLDARLKFMKMQCLVTIPELEAKPTKVGYSGFKGFVFSKKQFLESLHLINTERLTKM